jgi:phytoene dehydrogenase-like protein
MAGEQKYCRRDFLANLLAYPLGIQGLDLAFNKRGAWAQAGSGAGRDEYKSFHGEAGSPVQISKFKVSNWTGDDPKLGHEMRNGDIPPFPNASQRQVEFVIIGGGMSGLASAYYLKDHDFLLLEQYKELGGHARGSSYHGIGYSYGAAYVGDDDDDELHHLIAALGLNPIKLDPSKNSWRFEKSWISGVYGDKGAFYQQFKRLKEMAQPVLRELAKTESLIPLESASLRTLDQTPFTSCLTGYDQNFVALLDSVLKSEHCLGVQRSSALAGYCVLEDVFGRSNVFPGGNGALSAAIVQRLDKSGSDRCISGAFVWSIEVKDNGVSIVYSTRDGAVHRVNAGAAVVATPPMVSARILTGIEDKAKATMLSFKYGSYLVANLLLKKKAFDGAYDNVVAPPFTFSDVVVAEKVYQLSGQYQKDMGSVLTVYQPYEPGSRGRPDLLGGDRNRFAGSIADQFEQLSPGIGSQIEEIVLTRWGHAMVVPNIGFFQRMSKFQSTDYGAIAFAHCSSQGLPYTESAVRAARIATKKLLNRKATTWLNENDTPSTTSSPSGNSMDRAQYPPVSSG